MDNKKVNELMDDKSYSGWDAVSIMLKEYGGEFNDRTKHNQFVSKVAEYISHRQLEPSQRDYVAGFLAGIMIERDKPIVDLVAEHLKHSYNAYKLK